MRSLLSHKVLDITTIALHGRFNASDAGGDAATELGSGKYAVIDCDLLEYISSSGVGILILAQEAFGKVQGGRMKLVRVRPVVAYVLGLAHCERLFDIEAA